MVKKQLSCVLTQFTSFFKSLKIKLIHSVVVKRQGLHHSTCTISIKIETFWHKLTIDRKRGQPWWHIGFSTFLFNWLLIKEKVIIVCLYEHKRLGNIAKVGNFGNTVEIWDLFAEIISNRFSTENRKMLPLIGWMLKWHFLANGQ